MNKDDMAERLASFVGGQAEIQNPQEGYLFRGEIKNISLRGEGHDQEYYIEFNWVAQIDRDSGVWKLAENKPYQASSLIYSFTNIGPGESGGDRVCLESYIVGEITILFPPDGSKLDFSRVQK